jgi:hypothetical protein
VALLTGHALRRPLYLGKQHHQCGQWAAATRRWSSGPAAAPKLLRLARSDCETWNNGGPTPQHVSATKQRIIRLGEGSRGTQQGLTWDARQTAAETSGVPRGPPAHMRRGHCWGPACAGWHGNIIIIITAMGLHTNETCAVHTHRGAAARPGGGLVVALQGAPRRRAGVLQPPRSVSRGGAGASEHCYILAAGGLPRRAGGRRAAPCVPPDGRTVRRWAPSAGDTRQLQQHSRDKDENSHAQPNQNVLHLYVHMA